ncbi:MAG: alpha-amylase family glycosyl hydrolase [Bacteroidales bacterium]
MKTIDQKILTKTPRGLTTALLVSMILICSCTDKKKNQKDSSAANDTVLTSEVRHPEWSKNAVIYEVNVRQYTEEGTFEAFREHLPRLKELGVDILWFMPIHPIGEKNKKGELGSYYSVKDYMDVNPEFGTMEDFKAVVDEAHEMGMYVILDWVANHTAWDNPLTKEHPDWYTKDSTGNFQPPEEDWSDVIELDYSVPEMRNYMIDALKFWVEEADIDGYRCDVAGMVPVQFWNRSREALDSIKPVFMLAEANEPILHKKAFDMTYAWDLHFLMNEIAQGKKNANDLNKKLKKEKDKYPKNGYRMMFTSNHDENSWKGTVYERLGDGVETFAVLSHTLPGMPLIYSGQEACMDKQLEFFEKDPIEWKECNMTELYKSLNKLKKENKALWNGEAGGEYQRIKTTDNKNVFAFIREKDDDKVFVVANLTDKPIDFRLKSEEYFGEYKEYFSEEEFTFNNENTEMKLEPWEYKVFQ